MSTNSSSPLNASHPSPLLPSKLFLPLCLNSTMIFSTFALSNIILILPLSIYVLYVGFQRWRRQRSTTSHTDHFTYHMVTMEIVSLMGCSSYCSGYYTGNLVAQIAGFYLFSIVLPGQTLFHCLTCVERYLAVVHPITYLGLKKGGGVRIRNISIGCVWLVCVGWMGVTYAYIPYVAFVPFISLFAVSLLVSSFCSVSILCALTRPSPGQKERVDQSKQRAFHTIVVIMGLLLVRFAGLLVCMIMYWVTLNVGGDACLVLETAFWFCLPSGLMLPLLYLYRTGKLPWCGHST